MAHSDDFRRQRRRMMARRAGPLPSMLRPPKARPSGLTRILSGVLLAILVLSGATGVAAGGAAYSAYAQLADSLKPRLEAMSQAADSFQTTRLYDRNGTLLYEFFGAGKRTRVTLDKVTPYLIDATIAIEDKTFFENPGVDYEGITKAFLRSLEAGEETGGASTITQQLIKLIVLTDDERSYENRYQRKLTEIILAQELSRRYTKKEILQLYLNEIYYGNLAYGIEAAANVYFDRSADNLDLAQAALLAGLPQLPNVYDPFLFAEGGVLRGYRLSDDWLEPNFTLPDDTPPPKWRQIAVLRQMVDEGYVSAAEARAAAAQDLKLSTREIPLNAPHFVFYIRKQLEDRYGPQFANQGLSVYTSIDLDLQNMVQQKAAERIAELEERNIHNAAVVVMQPNTGEILAMVGSIDYNSVVPTPTPGGKGNVLDGQVNVTVRERQPGSALKPFTYLSAMESGATPASVFWDVPTRFPLTGNEWYEPKNYNGRWNGPVRMRTALANSLNMPAVLALKFAGIDHTIDLLHRAGITTLQRGANYYGLALTLGGGEVTPLELTTAYNTLASNGRYYPPVGILKIVGPDKRTLDEFKPTQRPQTLNPDHVAIISNILSDDKAREPVWGLDSKLKLSRPAAVKTGTSNDWRDAWAVGYTPYVTVGVWTGNNNNEETAKVESLTGGGVIWHNVMEELFANPRFERILTEPYPNQQLPLNFELPKTLVRQPICKLPGKFNNFSEDLFDDAMIKAAAQQRDQKVATQAQKRGEVLSDGCSLVTKVQVLAYNKTTDADGKVSEQYCRPQPGSVPEGLLTTIDVWRLPPPDPSIKVEYRWEGGSANSESQIPECSEDMLAVSDVPPAALEPGAIKMPNLFGLGENQAKEALAKIGIYSVYVDYQTRDRIPDIFDQYGPYVVVSTLPKAGEWVPPDSTVILGIRAPE